MTKLAVIIGVALKAATVWSIVITDDFNRADQGLTSDGAQISANGENSSTLSKWGISHGWLISETVGPAAQPVLSNAALSMVSGNGTNFTLTLDVMDLSGDAWAGVAFNYQDEKNVYWFRLKTGANNLSLVRFVGGFVERIAEGAITSDVALDTEHTLTVSSPEAFTFDYEIKETATGEVLVTGSATDANSSFTGGYAGVLQSTTGPKRNSFDNFRVEVIS
jgi:outer membrane lipoprotein-sorting protein